MAEEESQYPQNRRPGEPQSQSGHCKEEKNLLTLIGFKLQITQPVLVIIT